MLSTKLQHRDTSTSAIPASWRITRYTGRGVILSVVRLNGQTAQ